MKLIHKIYERINNKPEFKTDLDKVNFSYHYEENTVIGNYVEFEISQTDPQWETISSVMRQYHVKGSYIRTEFSSEELLNSEHLVIESNWHNGYPMPDDDNGYLELTYDLSVYCSTCGVGLVQKSPFRLKSDPKWSRKHFFHLNCVFDILFTQPEVWREVFEPFGVKCRPVLKYKKDTVLDNVVQLDITEYADSTLKRNGLRVVQCPACHRKKYEYIEYGPYPTFEIPQPYDLFKTKEYFGSGAAADQLIIVSQKLYRHILKKQVRGIRFVPMVDDPQEYIRTHLE
jgi:hypothetical protein